MTTLSRSLRAIVWGSATAASALLFAGTAAAQTMTLEQSNATTVRGGAYAGANFGRQPVLETRASNNPTYVRRALLKFDTDTTIPAGRSIASARLTITMAGGNSEARLVSAFGVTTAYDEAEATWRERGDSTAWSRAGGDIGTRYDRETVTNRPGSRVTFDVTALVRAVTRGDFGARYTRIALVDEGDSSRGSYKKIHSDEASVQANRPVLTVTLAAASAPPPAPPVTPPPPPAPPVEAPEDDDGSEASTGKSSLRVLQYNVRHGGFGTDGRYDTKRVATWIAKMKPDVVLMNEIEKYTGWGNQNQPEVYRNLLEASTGKRWYQHFAQEYGDWNSNGKGNLILSTVPFQHTDRYELVHNGDRSIAAATIRWNGRPITFILTHLDHESYSLRLKQAIEVTTWAASEPENKILAGDMNAWPDQSSVAQFNRFFHDSWAVAVSKGKAVAFSGNNGETKKGRIDYIYYSKGSPHLSVQSSRVFDTRDSRGVMPSDHRPLLTTFEVR